MLDKTVRVFPANRHNIREIDGLYYASDYFDQLYEWAIKLIKDGKAYVDDLTADETR